MDNSQHNFPTGSSHSGEYNEHTYTMEGFGIYTYPDGSEYRGLFLHGVPHGYGRITLAHPYRLRLKCHFLHGEMISVEDEMTFHDGLVFNAKVSDDFKYVDFSKWNYLKYVFKQSCRDILDRNIIESNESQETHKLCLATARKLHQKYLPGVCNAYSKFDPKINQDEVDFCHSKGSTMSSSLTIEPIIDEGVIEICKNPEAFEPILPEYNKRGPSEIVQRRSSNQARDSSVHFERKSTRTTASKAELSVTRLTNRSTTQSMNQSVKSSFNIQSQQK